MTRSIKARVLARLPEADRQRDWMRRRQRRQRLIAVALASLMLVAFAGPQASDSATRALAWLYAADVAWRGLVLASLGSVSILPAASAACLLGLSVALWYRLLSGQRRGVR